MQGEYKTAAQRDQRLIEGVIANLPLFWGMAPPKLGAVACGCWVLPAPRGATLVERGSRLPGILALAYGSLKLVLRKRDGAERVLRLISARQTFGEPLALLGKSSPYYATALQDSKLVVIPTRAVQALLDSDPRFARGLVTALAERNVQLHAEIEAATQLNGTQRLASYLNELAGGAATPPTTVRLPFSKTLVASRLGLKKETLSRLLRELVEQRVIEMARRDIAILDPGRLAGLARANLDPVAGA
jgi:CRP-like cAMP-binding protein